QHKPPYWVWNGALNQLYMSAYHLSTEAIPYYLDAIVRHRIVYLIGYSSTLFALAQEALQVGRRDIQLAVVVANAEPLLSHQRELIADAFRCPVRESYGMAEAVAAASECEHGRMHLWPEVGLVEVHETGQAARAGATGELICTGLLNADMPLIRYR